MSKVLTLLGLGAVLAIVKAVVVALALGTMLASLICLARWPRETIACGALLTVGGLGSARPAEALLLLIVALSAASVAGMRRRRGDRSAQLQGPRSD